MKIDPIAIEGFDAMSPEDKIKALLELEFPDSSEIDRLKADNQKQKDLITKYTGEISSLKKAQNASLSDAERKTKEQEETLADLQQRYNELLKKSTVGNYAAKLITLGYPEDMALESATALVDGDMDRVFENSAKFKTSLEKQYKAEVVKSTPKPDSKGGVTAPKSREDIMKIKDASERQKAIAENIELFTKEN
jgi:hypothetical protein